MEFFSKSITKVDTDSELILYWILENPIFVSLLYSDEYTHQYRIFTSKGFVMMR